MDKMQLRQQFRKMLFDMDPEDLKKRSRQACKNLVDTEEFANAGSVMVFLSLPNEIDTCELILTAWQKGKVVAAPKVSWQQRHMIPVEINTLDTGFSTDVAGLRNPVRGTPVPFSDIDLVVTPGLGFDKFGNRLGRGGSYYDRFFSNENVKTIKCALAFQEQFVDEIPVTDDDVPVDMLVTDERVIHFKSSGQ